MLDEAKRWIYEAACRQYIAQFLPDYVCDAAVLRISIAGQHFEAKGIRAMTAGWTAALGRRAEKDGEGEADLPAAKSGDPCRCSAAKTVCAKTKPPAAFTEGTLIKAMENIGSFMDLFEKDPEKLKSLRQILKEGDGIGTSATRAEVVNRLKEKKYAEAMGKKLVSTELGRAVVDAVPELVKSPGFTAVFEKKLAEVAAGNRSAEAFVAKQAAFVEGEVKRVRTDEDFLVGSVAPRIVPGVKHVWDARRVPSASRGRGGNGSKDSKGRGR